MTTKTDSTLNEKQLFIRNLSYNTTKDDLLELFQDHGPIKNVSLVEDSHGKSRGYGFVKFSLEEDAKTAIDKFQEYNLHGRRIKLELAVKPVGRKKKGSSNDDNTNIDAKAEAEAEAESAVDNEDSMELEKNDTDTDKEVEVNDSIAKKSNSISTSKPQERRSNEATATATASAVEKERIRRTRQILVFGVPTDISKKMVVNSLGKTAKKVEFEVVTEDHALSASLPIISPAGKILLLTGNSRQHATKVADILMKSTTKSLGLRTATVEKSDDKSSTVVNKVERFTVRTLADITPVDLIKRKCRLIIRNLSFQATEQNVLDKFAKFGPLVNVEIPKTTIEKTKENTRKRKREDENTAQSNVVVRPKGFAFVTFLCENDAQAAVEANGKLKVCNREVAIDFCMNKETYTKYGVPTEEGEDTEEKNVEVSTEKKVEEHDGTSSEAGEHSDNDDDQKESIDEEGKTENNATNDHGTDETDSNDEDEDDAEEDDEEDIDEDDEGDVDEDANHEMDEDEDEALQEVNEETTKTKTVEDDTKEGCSLFIRDVPFDAEPIAIKKAFGKYGRIVMAVIVKDKITQMSKGSAFLKFASQQSVEKCFSDIENGIAININDRPCRVDLAVDREKAQSFNSSTNNRDKRNLYLANEGLIITNTGKDDKKNVMSESDKEKRQRAQTEKRKKLQNPLFFVSAHRLSIRNIGKQMTDNDLTNLCIEAAKNGIERKLVSVNDVKKQHEAQGNSGGIYNDLLAPKLSGKDNNDVNAIPPVVKKSVKSAKIMLDQSKVRNNLPQSRGYGFIEFYHHVHALACLRELNNNGKYNAKNLGADTKNSKFIVEFSLENIQKVKILKTREQKRLENHEKQVSESKSNKKEKRVVAVKDVNSDEKESITVVNSKDSMNSSKNLIVESAKSVLEQSPEKKQEEVDEVEKSHPRKKQKFDSKKVLDSKPLSAHASEEIKTTNPVSTVTSADKPHQNSFKRKFDDNVEEIKESSSEKKKRKKELRERIQRRKEKNQAKRDKKLRQRFDGLDDSLETSGKKVTTPKEKSVADKTVKSPSTDKSTEKKSWGGHKRVRAQKKAAAGKK